ELASVELQGEGLGEVALLRLEHLHLDDLGRADVLAEATADAVLLARLRVVGEREHAAEPVRVVPGDGGVVHRYRLPEEIDEGGPHGAEPRAAEVAHLAQEPARRHLRRHCRSSTPPTPPSP